MIANTSPRISILLPTYNRASLIMETIQSVRDQTFPDWELVVINDQSTDNTEMLIQSLEDPRIRVVNTVHRLGITGSRNEGLSRALGTWIAFIDSDDLWHPQKLERQWEALQQHPDAGFCLTGGYNFRISGVPEAYFYQQQSGIRYGDLLVPFFQSEAAATTSAILFKKELLDKTGWFDAGKSFADVDFMLRLARQANGLIVYEPLFFRRLHDNNISDHNWEQGCEEGIQLAKLYRHKLPAGLGRKALYKAYINFGEKCLVKKKPGKALAKFFRAWLVKPFRVAAPKKMVKAVLFVFKK